MDSALKRFYKHTLNQLKNKFIDDHSKVMLVLWFILIVIVCQLFVWLFAHFVEK